ncbi:hypothetical protein GGR61_003587 [Xanthomonas arboricola]|nr:hypothetical protein [Xanthomonas sp. 3075]MBB5865923.1 hypothetical protein [Xanthomonas sp. 3058]
MDTKDILVGIQIAVLIFFGIFRWYMAGRREGKKGIM